MKRLLLVVVLGALAAGLTGCDVSPPAATVDGATISQSTLNAYLAGVASDAPAQCAAQIQAGQTASPLGVGTEGDGTTPNAVTPSFAASELNALILDQVERQALARRGVRVTAAEVADAVSDYESQLTTQLQQEQSANDEPSDCALSVSEPLSRQLPHAFAQRQGAVLADQEMFEAAVGHLSLGTTALQSYYRAHLAEVTQECLDVIVTTSQANAQAVRAQIAAGASFATAVRSPQADSAASPSDGQLACAYPAQISGQLGASLGATVDALSSGALSPPLEWQPTNPSTGQASTFYLVVQMRQHVIVPFATLRSAIRQSILQAHATVVSTALRRLTGQAQISVDPRYGRWSDRGVTVPPVPAPAFVPNAQADVRATPFSLGGLNTTPAG